MLRHVLALALSPDFDRVEGLAFLGVVACIAIGVGLLLWQPGGKGTDPRSDADRERDREIRELRRRGGP